MKSNTEWDDLQQMWQSLPAKAAPAALELERMARWRWLSLVFIAGDVVLTLVGIGAGVWLLSRGGYDDAIIGLAAISLSLGAGGLSFWARQVSVVHNSDSIRHAVGLAVRRARIGVRLSLAVMWAVCLGLFFTAVVLFADSYGPESRPVHWAPIAVIQLWLGLSLAGSLIYHRRRQADLSRLEAIAAELNEVG